MTEQENVFTILGIAGAEDPVNNLIANSLENVPSFRKALLGLLNLDQYEVTSALTRKKLNGKIPDVVVGLEDSEGRDPRGLVIESKLFAKEGSTQTGDYSTPAFRNSVRSQLSLPDDAQVIALYLSLYQEPAISETFGSFTHEQLLEAYRKSRQPGSTSTGWSEKLLEDWMDLLHDFYQGAALHQDDDLLSALKQDSALDSSYLYFQKWIGSLPFRSGLVPGTPFRDNYRGRPGFGCQILKESWRPSRMHVDAEPVAMDPKRHFTFISSSNTTALQRA